MSLRQSARSFSARMWDRLFDSRCKPRRNPQRSRLSLESLEDRLAPATLTVLNTSDSGIGSLRAQIALAQSGDTILLDATVFANHPTIALGSSLGIIHSVSISGPTKGVTLDAGGRFEVIDVGANATAFLSGLTIADGSGPSGGGVSNLGTLTLTDCVFANNSGGAIESSGVLNVNACTFSHNTATLGGGAILNVNGPIANTAPGLGTTPGLLTVRDSTFVGNSATLGGAIYTSGSATIADSTFTGNSASSNGGAILDFQARLTVSGSTVSGNSASHGMGGIFTSSNRNLALIGGSGISTLTLTNSIVAGNINGDLDLEVQAKNIVTNNVIGTTNSTTLVNGVNGNHVGVSNPGLSALGWYGGPTETLALLPGSPALGKGTTTTPDQRGFARHGKSLDIGAYQTQAGGIAVNTTADSPQAIGLGKTSLREAVALESLAPAPVAITFDPTVFANHPTIALDSPLHLTKSVSITGPAKGVTLDAGGRFEVIDVSKIATVSLSGLTIADGSGPSGGGVSNLGTLTLTDCVFANNSGGAIESSGVLSVNACTFSHNTASLGGGAILNVSGPIANTAAGLGNTPGLLTVRGSTFVGNSATLGGAIYTSGSATIADSTFTGNSANIGGAILDFAAQLTVSGSTVSGNSAEFTGGIFTTGDPHLRLIGGSLAVASLTLNNSIVASNSNGDVDTTDKQTSINANNVIGSTSDSALVNGTNGNQVGVSNPGLSALGWYGGPTETLALLPGSPAIGKGTTTTPDQRGYARLTKSSDIGAFQTQSGGIVVNTTADNPQAIGLGKTSLREAIALESLATGPVAAITFDPKVFANHPTIALDSPLHLSKSVSITGPAKGVTLDAGGRFEVVDVGEIATVSLSGLTIADGSGSFGGGVSNLGTLTLTDCVFSNNFGGAIESSGILTVNASTFSHNTATLGGAIMSVNSPLTSAAPGSFGTPGLLSVNKSTFVGNSATLGGAIYTSGNATIADSTLTGNFALSGGGVYNTGVLALVRSTLYNDFATDGGGAYNTGTLNITDSTIANNNGQRRGGGVFDSGMLTVNGSTIAANTGSASNQGGGLYLARNATTFLSNTIVAGNTAITGADIFGTVNSSDHDLIGNTDSTTLLAGNGDLLNVEPMLAPLGYYGGPTRTMPLLPGSVGIDAGDDTTTGPQGLAGLTHWYQASGNATDSVGGSNGTLVGVVGYAPGVAGQSFQFTGGYAQFASPSIGTSDFSSSFWLQTTNANFQAVLGNRVDYGHGNFFAIRMSGGHLTVELDEDGSGTNYVGFLSNRTLDDGVFHQIAVVRSGTMVSLYIDGVLDNSGSSAGVTNISAANNLVLGAEPAVGLPTFSGKLDEVAFFSRALGASEVQSLFDAPIGNAGTDQRGFARLVGAHEDIGATEYQYNLGVSISAPATVSSGGMLTYTLTLTNNGPDAVLGASLTDLLPQGVTFQSWTAPKGWATTTPAIGQGGSVTAVDGQLLAAGASVTFTLTVQVPPGTATGTTLSDMAWVAPFSWDLFGADNTATFNTTVL